MEWLLFHTDDLDILFARVTLDTVWRAETVEAQNKKKSEGDWNFFQYCKWSELLSILLAEFIVIILVWSDFILFMTNMS